MRKLILAAIIYLATGLSIEAYFTTKNGLPKWSDGEIDYQLVLLAPLIWPWVLSIVWTEKYSKKVMR